jgi:hypothetical protein
LRRVEFRRLLDEDNALRVRFEVEQGQVVAFVVQLECAFDRAWQPVIRYDTAHGFTHCDTLHPTQPPIKQRIAAQNYNEALTYAIQDLTANWSRYRRRYQTWQKQE